MPTLRELLNEPANTILRRDAEVLAQHVLGRDRAWLLAHPEAEVSDEDAATLRALAERRAAGTPLQHLTGVQEFFGRPFAVNGDVLIPRPETELLVEAVLEWVRAWRGAEPLRILDVGAGSGAIAVTLALELPEATVTAVDLSPAALGVAQRNAERLGATVRFVESDLLRALTSEQPAFDVVVSNPPYVPFTDARTLATEVVDHEPHLALFAEDEGLAVYRRLIPQAHAALPPGGLLAMEFGFGQREAVRELFGQQRYEDASPQWTEARFRDDYAGIPRVVLAERR